MTAKTYNYKGYQIVRGEYTGTTDDRADRWYIQDPDPTTPVNRVGEGYATIAEAKQAINERERNRDWKETYSAWCD